MPLILLSSVWLILILVLVSTGLLVYWGLCTALLLHGAKSTIDTILDRDLGRIKRSLMGRFV